MTCETLWNLRMEISLCSMYYADFRNSCGIDEHAVCDFFDGYANYLQELMNGDEAGRGNNHFFDFLEQYDLSLIHIFCPCRTKGMGYLSSR